MKKLTLKKLTLPPWFGSLGVWIVPLVSVTTVPFFLQGQQSSDRPPNIPPLPPPSQLPAPGDSLLMPPQPLFPPGDRPAPSPSAQPKSLVSHSQTPAPPSQPAASKSASSQTKARVSPPQVPSEPRPLATPIDYTPPPLEIRVAIHRDEPSISIGTSQKAVLRDRDGKLLETISGGRGLWVQPQGDGLIVGGQSKPGILWLQPSEGSSISVGDRWYRGKVLLVTQGNSLMAVNYVNLEQYLYSVVGSEMHANAPSEALKAQAIAARSYALVHMIRPASDWFDLGNTQRWQVYKGLQSEYNTTQEAVNATAGKILSHSGGVVESLYAATDEIVSRAHGGRGMSQTGAYELARQGLDYVGILSRYYPEVGLARVVLKQ